ncbi:MAG TPA: hypothetical protein VKG43_09825 [Acidimicrobiales bacterium]|nr:hypothetical protein [Acidimicrobiales bacterium]
MDDQNLDLDLLASSLQADSGDVRVLLKALATRLSGALGERMRVEREGGRLRKSDAVKRLSIALGDDRYDAVLDGGALTCTVAHMSGGIRIRSATVTMDEWLRQLLGDLRQEAASSQATRTALEQLVIGDGA